VGQRAAHREFSGPSRKPARTITDDANGLTVNVVPRHALRAASRSNALHPATMPVNSRPCRSGRVQRMGLNETSFIFVSEPLLNANGFDKFLYALAFRL